MNRSTTRKRQPAKRRKPKKRGKFKKSFLTLTMLLVLIAVVVLSLLLNRGVRTEKVTDDDVVEKIEEVKPETVEEAIRYAVAQLGVPNRLVRRVVRDDGVHFSVLLDRNRVDLNFANMIFTGQIELYGGEILSGEETGRGSAHVLRVYDPAAEEFFIIRLSYDRGGNYADTKPKLGIVVDDFGMFAGSLLDEWLEVHPGVTFAILPDLRHSTTVMERAAAQGRETILHIPMEPLNYPRINPGDNPILVEHNNREIGRIMENYLRQLPKVSGANNHMGSLATADERVMSAVLDVLERHDLYFVDSRTTVHSVALEIAQRKLIPSAARDLFIDEPDSSDKTIRERLGQLRRLKEQKERVIVITHCFDRERLTALKKFIDEAEKMGFEIVPVSEFFVTDLPEIL